jgi:hypothetical protein
MSLIPIEYVSQAGCQYCYRCQQPEGEVHTALSLRKTGSLSLCDSAPEFHRLSHATSVAGLWWVKTTPQLTRDVSFPTEMTQQKKFADAYIVPDRSDCSSADDANSGCFWRTPACRTCGGGTDARVHRESSLAARCLSAFGGSDPSGEGNGPSMDDNHRYLLVAAEIVEFAADAGSKRVLMLSRYACS